MTNYRFGVPGNQKLLNARSYLLHLDRLVQGDADIIREVLNQVTLAQL